jgi:hypothetical protein
VQMSSFASTICVLEGLLEHERASDGTWLLESTHRGAVQFELENGDGRARRWNTLRASRVLNWWDLIPRR